MWRVQVKTSIGKRQHKSESWRFQSRVKESAIKIPRQPELHFVFALRMGSYWGFIIIARNILADYLITQDLGTLNNDYRQFTFLIRDTGEVFCSKTNLIHCFNNWNTWPILGSEEKEEP